MRFRPTLPDSTLACLLEEHFGLAPDGLTFLPLGEDGWVYRAHGPDGTSWLAGLKQEPARAAFEVASWLHDHAGLEWVVAPRPSLTGRYVVPAEEFWLTLTPWVEGSELMARGLFPGEGGHVGRLLAQLHAATSGLPGALRELLPQENFRRHREMALKVLRAARQPWPADSIQAALAELIEEKGVLLQQVLGEAQDLGERLRREELPLVLCHADFHAANILVGEDGRWWVIDWDGLLLAPPERDLSFWYDSPAWEEIARAYGLQHPPRRDLLKYYALEWVLQEIADYGENIFFLPFSAEQKADSFAAFRQLFAPGDVVEQALRCRG